MENVTAFLKEIKDRIKKSNQELLDIYYKLETIQQEEIWKDKRFYEGQEEFSYEQYRKMTFYVFIKQVCNITGGWFRAINAILELENGKELFLQYGYRNMQTYKNRTEEERKAILNEVKTNNRASDFFAIARELFPSTRENRKDNWEEKYKTLNLEFQEYKEKNEKEKMALVFQFQAYKKKIEQLFTTQILDSSIPEVTVISNQIESEQLRGN